MESSSSSSLPGPPAGGGPGIGGGGGTTAALLCGRGLVLPVEEGLVAVGGGGIVKETLAFDFTSFGG